MRSKWFLLALTVAVFLIGLIAVGPIMSDVEHPRYEVISSEKMIEIRQYAPMIIAEVEIEGEREEAIRKGFNLLADYIFGNNSLKEGISMTAPVEQKQNQKIAMTAPVEQQLSEGDWKVRFIMPSKYTMETLPRPVNEQVVLREVPPKKWIAIRFSGRQTKENLEKHEKMLRDYIEENEIRIIGLPKFAFYNPPWTLPFMRRNEVMFEMKGKGK